MLAHRSSYSTYIGTKWQQGQAEQADLSPFPSLPHHNAQIRS
jgi:hypothetical protein